MNQLIGVYKLSEVLYDLLSLNIHLLYIWELNIPLYT